MKNVVMMTILLFSSVFSSGTLAQNYCDNIIQTLVDELNTDGGALNKAMKAALGGLQDIPENYGPWNGVNPWRMSYSDFVPHLQKYFLDWCEFLPTQTGSHGAGLKQVQEFSMFYYHNISAYLLVHGFDPYDPTSKLTDFADFLEAFNKKRGEFMDSADSTKNIQAWIDDPRIEIQDYTLQKASDYPSWNAFFTRELTRVDPNDPQSDILSRPVTMPNRNYVVVAPTDCIMNPLEQPIVSQVEPPILKRYIENPLDLNTVISVKDYPISVDRLLGNAPDELKQPFDGGTGLNCVLMPNTYHHFHAPVDGEVVYTQVVEAGTWGYIDFPNWAPQDGNAGRPGMDFSEFETWTRGVVIIKVSVNDASGNPKTGYVAALPVGLNTAGTVVLDDYIAAATPDNPVNVKKGNSRIGNFLFGGSTYLILFSKGLMTSSAVQVRLGNQIAILDTPE